MAASNEDPNRSSLLTNTNIINNGEVNTNVVLGSGNNNSANNLNTIGPVNSTLTSGGYSSNGDSIEELSKEVESLKKKLEEERAKFNDVERNWLYLYLKMNLSSLFLSILKFDDLY